MTWLCWSFAEHSPRVWTKIIVLVRLKIGDIFAGKSLTFFVRNLCLTEIWFLVFAKISLHFHKIFAKIFVKIFAKMVNLEVKSIFVEFSKHLSHFQVKNCYSSQESSLFWSPSYDFICTCSGSLNFFHFYVWPRRLALSCYIGKLFSFSNLTYD